ncbi:hypothetical protein PIB30_013090 [Stylosanthes scabra]|uniref:Uncharacterized protein n=1 Tax=Stylosanthes scabra TaxID=79078 RepID=A0ABU6V5T6_9FABA|nr:hypothetical protein [Stylosanthes scabra]
MAAGDSNHNHSHIHSPSWASPSTSFDGFDVCLKRRRESKWCMLKENERENESNKKEDGDEREVAVAIWSPLLVSSDTVEEAIIAAREQRRKKGRGLEAI